MDNENVMHILRGVLLSHKMNEILSFTATWMELTTITLSKINQVDKDKCLMISVICRILKI